MTQSSLTQLEAYLVRLPVVFDQGYLQGLKVDGAMHTLGYNADNTIMFNVYGKYNILFSINVAKPFFEVMQAMYAVYANVRIASPDLQDLQTLKVVQTFSIRSGTSWFSPPSPCEHAYGIQNLL